MVSRFCGFGVFSLIGIVAIGCGSDGPELGTVTGQVTMNGKALPNALVTFVPEAGGRAATGTTDASGNYTLIFLDRDGALLGKHRVSVTTLQQEIAVEEVSSDNPDYLKQSLGTGSANAKATPKEAIPERYNTKTELIQEVKSGSNVLNLELKSG